ncbi:MAG: phage portal protein, partial [Planctomycetota bacterium]|nr:phage portal protein [Planctomycetota bacterium]
SVPCRKFRQEVAMIARAATPRRDTVESLLRKYADLEPAKRAERLEEELRARVAEQKIALLESVPRRDELDPSAEDDEAWDELGVGGRLAWSRSNPALRTLHDLTQARDTCRELAAENDYAIGAHERLQDYVVGYGITWTAVPRNRQDEDEALTARVGDAIKRIQEQEAWGLLEREWVLREDRDGEAFMRTFPNAYGPMRLRFVEPEWVAPPIGGTTHPFGVEAIEGDPVAYWIRQGASHDPARVERWHVGLEVREGRVGIPQVLHSKLNVDANSPRGWPTLYPCRRPLTRATKLLRNMGYVAALQAAIALIKRYDNATQAQVEDLLAHTAEARIRGRSGRSVDYIETRPGTVWHAPRGTTYEAPISSVNAANNVEVLQAELRAAAVRVGFPEYMFSGRASGVAYSSELVKESPFVKKIEARQWCTAVPLHEAMQASLVHEEFWGRLPRGTVDAYELVPEFPNPVVRDVLQDRQGKQILLATGVMSRRTWRATEGLDDTTEERNLDLERRRGYADTRVGDVEPDKPPPGSTDGGPGGSDQKGAEPGKPGRPPGSSEEGAAAAPAEEGAAPAAPGAAEAVQDTALNGAQVQALKDVIQAVAAKQLPAAAAVEMLVAAFPAIGREAVQRMVNAAAAFVPAGPEAPL